MNIEQYHKIYLQESKHFYYQAMHHNVLSLLSKFARSKKGLVILDAGCGTGLLAKKLARFGEVFAIDSSPEALKFCKKRGIRNVVLASVTKLPFKNKTFDVVTCVDVLYHRNVESDIKAFREFERVLKPGGLLIVKVPAHKYLGGVHDVLVHTKHRFEKEEIRNKLRKSKLEVLFLSYGHFLLFLPLLLKKYIEKFSGSNESNVAMPSKPINILLILLSKIETSLMLNLGLTNGISIYVVTTRTEE